jgi:hypothetical protein
LADSASRHCTGGDAYEPDDRAEQATTVEIDGRAQTHNFHLRSDHDWIKLEAQAGAFYRIEARAVGERSDPLVWLYDSDGVTPLAYDDDGGKATGAALVWRAPRQDTFYVEVQDMAGASGDGTAYHVVVQTEPLTIYLPVAAR